MRSSLAVLVATLALGGGSSAPSYGQTTPCVGLTCQQQTSCPNGGTTSVSGVVYAPNGIDPLPNVTVYVPNAAVAPFTAGVSCPVVGQPPSGSPIAGTTTAADGSFTISNMPAGTNIPLVIVSGRWRRQLVIPSVSACANTALPSTPLPANSPLGTAPLAFASFPQNQSQGDIPKIAIATGSADSVECVLRKVGIADSEFTDSTGSGRINLYLGSGSPGSQSSTGAATPSETALMSTPATLSSYDLLMLPCEGGAYTRPAGELSNLVSFANSGGRIYSSHYSYVWMINNAPFNTVVNWTGNQSVGYPDGTLATVNAGFSGGQTLTTWLQDVGASTTPGQIGLSAIKHDFSSVNPPTESWLTLDVTGNPVMQFVFDAPVPVAGTTTGNQCGRVLYNEYHVENPTISNTGKIFPAECPTGSMTPQEKLLEYSLFELTNDGGAATLTPATTDFGTEAVGFNSPVKTFIWTNNSTFPASVTLLTGSQDFNLVGSNPCTLVPAYGSCTISMVFNPSVIGAETGTLSVGSNGSTLTAALSGTGIPDLTLSTASLSYGSVDVGASVTQTVTVTNGASGAVPVPALVTTGDYTATVSCGTSLPAGATCAIAVTFKPSTSGPRPGTLTLQTAVPGTPATLTGNGIDFTLTASPASGTVIAGYNSSTVATTTPLAGFNNQLSLGCTTNAPGSTCTLSSNAFAPSAAVTTNVTITTTAQYAVVGYGGFGGSVRLGLLGLATGALLWMKRRSLGTVGRRTLTLALLALSLGALTLGVSGCSGKLPAQNANYTVPGTYSYTISATDGFLVHSATYSLNVTAK